MTDMKQLKKMKFNGQKLSNMRIQSGLTLEALGEEIEVDLSSISLWEDGKRQPGPSNLKKIADYFKVPVASFLASLLILVGGLAQAEQAGPAYFNQVVDAIYKAEGGAKTRHPFGILSVKCEGYDECRQICYNTVKNNYGRWTKAGAKGEYLQFLANRYCPIGADNDPRGLNKNWLKNVKYFLS